MRFIYKNFVIRPFYEKEINECHLGKALGVPRGNNSDFVAYEAVALWLMKQGIKYICGQVLSGAQMAFAVSMASQNNITPVYVPKDGYFPRKHDPDYLNRSPYVIIDDIIFTGDAIRDTIKILKKVSGADPTFIIAHSISWTYNPNELSKDIFYTVSNMGR